MSHWWSGQATQGAPLEGILLGSPLSALGPGEELAGYWLAQGRGTGEERQLPTFLH